MPSTWTHLKKERESAMKTNTIQIIRILCLRPALMPSRGFSAGIGAEPDPQKEELAKTKASSAPGGGVGGVFPSPAPTAWPSTLKAEHLKQLPSPTSWGTLQASKSVGTLGPGGLLTSLLGRARSLRWPRSCLRLRRGRGGIGRPTLLGKYAPLGVGVGKSTFVCERSCEGEKRCLFSGACKYGSCCRAISRRPSF